jgi:hypothetical protein
VRIALFLMCYIKVRTQKVLFVRLVIEKTKGMKSLDFGFKYIRFFENSIRQYY